jgi:uncharacterized protein (TIGR03083 family)
MATTITAGQWNAAREALRVSAGQFADLACSRDPGAMATRDWSIADTVSHVTAIALWDTALVRPGDLPFPHPWNLVEDQVRGTTVDTVDALNERILERFPERDPRILVKHLGAHVDDMLRATAGLDPDSPVDWLGGARVPLAGIFAHLTNELQIHGWDIARAAGVRWTIPSPYAAQFLELFVAGLGRHGIGGVLDKKGPPLRRRIAVRLESRFMGPLTLVALPGGSAVTGDPGTPVDVRVWLEPAAFNLMMFGRISRLRAALTGKVLVGGPRPWLLSAFLRVVRFPS